jgi:hypothetical protein
MPRPRRFEPLERRTCGWCGKEFDALTDNIRKGWGLFCSRACTYADIRARPRTAKPVSIRQIEPGEAVPLASPRRYKNAQGYVRLRWRVGGCEYVECYEHRVVNGIVTDAEHVHHVNGNRADNRPENLKALQASEHARHHNRITWDVSEAARLYGDGWSLPKLGRKYGVHSSVILRGFQRRGIPTRPRPGAAA